MIYSAWNNNPSATITRGQLSQQRKISLQMIQTRPPIRTPGVNWRRRITRTTLRAAPALPLAAGLHTVCAVASALIDEKVSKSQQE